MAVISDHHGFGALRHPNFSFYLLARFCATLAVQMQGVAVGWQVYSLSGNPLDLGWIGLVQLETPDAIRGRVSAVNSVFIGASNELGEFESGMAAAWLGLAPSIIVGGCATLLVALFWAHGFPALRTMDYFPHPRR